MVAVHFDSKDDDALRRTRLYNGDIYVYSPTPSGLELCELAQEMSEEAFTPHFPPTAQHHVDVESYVEVLKALKPGFIHHPECKRIIPNLLHELGASRDHTYFDVPRLRTACAGDFLQTGMAYAFKAHRDTWYSPPMCQINWWLPVYPNESDNGMAFHPNYWTHPVRNDSIHFNYQDWNTNGRAQASKQSTKKDTRFQSAALDQLDLEPDLRLVCPPGGVIVFAAAHLHSTVPNTTEATRFSIDFRTVDSRDIAEDRGAPNLDSESTGTTLMDYLRATDLEHFSDAEVERYKSLPRRPRFPNDLTV